MKVFVCRNLQGHGYEAVCDSLKKAKQWIQDSIIQHQGNQDDPNPWDGWHWYMEKGVHCFGCTEEAFLKDFPGGVFFPCAEATVKEFEVI